MFVETTAMYKVARMTKRIRAVQGGTSASKTISILQILIDMAQCDTVPTTTSVVSESFPHLERGAIKDFLAILQQHDYYEEARWHRTKHTYTFESGSIIEFFSVDEAGKARGPRRQRLFINEANNIKYETADQLIIRTSELVFLDWNPTAEFWFEDYGDGSGKGVKDRDDCEHLILTYKDNEGLQQSLIEEIERHIDNKRWWRVYGQGLVGEVEGRIFTGWKLRDDVPHEARLVRFILDFGYTNDPTALGALYEYNGGYIVDELAYNTGLMNRQIADIILNQEEQALTVGDSSEPKSIDEIKERGVRIIGSVKGADSVRNGIQVVQGVKITLTKRSINFIKAYRNYMWMKDKNGVFVVPEEPEHEWSHGMDAIRYGITSIIKPPKKGVHIHRPRTSGRSSTMRPVGAPDAEDVVKSG